MKTELQNIETNSLTVIHSQDEIKHNVSVKIKTEGEFKLTNLAIKAILIGSHLEISQITTEHERVERQIPQSTSLLLIKLSLYSLEDGINNNGSLSLKRFEVELMKKYLLLRMAHCNKDKDSENGQFNASTYISMKELLGDLNMWLSVQLYEGEVIIPEEAIKSFIERENEAKGYPKQRIDETDESYRRRVEMNLRD